MKVLNTRRKLIALLPLVVIAILSTGNRIGAVPDQNKEVREAANEGGIWIGAGITQGQVLRFSVARPAIVAPGPPNHSGGVNLELRVFDSQGNLLITHRFPNQNQNGGIWISFFDLSAAQLPPQAFDNTGRAELTGIVKAVDPSDPSGVVASGEIFSIGDVNRQTLVHIAGTRIFKCNGR